MILPYLRVTVSGWRDKTVTATSANPEIPLVTVICGNEQMYIMDILVRGVQLNLIDVSIDEIGRCTAELIVFCPDYLIDISLLAACFREYGHHPLIWLVNKISPKNVNVHTLLGNLAGQMLDDCVNETPEHRASYSSSLWKYFPSAALDFCMIDVPRDFHTRAMEQMVNIHRMINELLPAAVPGFRREKTLLEASFICERLGLQGRADMMQTDCSLLIEQKSGKRDEYRHAHKVDHYVQMMLYQAVMQCNFGVKADGMRTFLLYSKYADGLMEEWHDKNLFRESIRLRNRIVALEMALADGGISDVIDSISPDLLNTSGTRGKLWRDYQRPQLQRVISVLKDASPLERAYFTRLFTFVSREVLLSKTGGTTDPTHGFAGTWRLSLEEKLESGNIIIGLVLEELMRSSEEKGFDIIRLRMSEDVGGDYLPNFRKGDMIMLYPMGERADAMTQVLMKGSIERISADRVTVRLRGGQQSKEVMCDDKHVYAIEHDTADSTAFASFRGLFAFLTAERSRRELLLGQREPVTDSSVTLHGDYGALNGLVAQEKRQRDCFLLIGPPGTGKTSCALRAMVEEALADEGSSLLLMAYTNRAVDEICDMLVSSGIAGRHRFIRLGSELSADSRFAPYMLQSCLGVHPSLEGVRRLLRGTRIFVSTTTTAANRIGLLSIHHFDVAFIDEASQILEPDLIGILSAKCGDSCSIRKWVLIGDYKQLPAISLQSSREAAVDNPSLRAIGLTDCRRSLFERLCQTFPSRCIGSLHTQGRMHPDIAEFPSKAFYPACSLQPVPLPHQSDSSPYPASAFPEDETDRFLITHRLIFIPIKAENDASASAKSNVAEARIAAALLGRIRRLTGESFSPERSVGVIVPYRSQIAMIRREMKSAGLEDMEGVSIDTVERYQGSQRDVIVFSLTVRDATGLAFLTESSFSENGITIDRKLNVAVTRARRQLLLIGDPDVLSQSPMLRDLILHIKGKGGYCKCL